MLARNADERDTTWSWYRPWGPAACQRSLGVEAARCGGDWNGYRVGGPYYLLSRNAGERCRREGGRPWRRRPMEAAVVRRSEAEKRRLAVNKAGVLQKLAGC